MSNQINFVIMNPSKSYIFISDNSTMKYSDIVLNNRFDITKFNVNFNSISTIDMFDGKKNT